MKLIVCAACGDLVGLGLAVRRCRCGRSAGCYERNLVSVRVGGPCLVLGLSRRELERIWSDPEITSTACGVIREPHPTVQRVDDWRNEHGAPP